MRIKSYFAESVHAAIEKARVELGPEALLLGSKTAAQAASGSAYEVTFGVTNDSRPELANAFAGAAPADGIARELAELRQQLENVQRSLAVAAPPVAPAKRGSARARAADLLAGAGFSRRLAQEIAEAALVRMEAAEDRQAEAQAATAPKTSRRGAAVAAGALREVLDEIEARLCVAPMLGSAEQEQKLVLLVGAPGAGKTTTLVKLAIAYGTRRSVPLQILTTDTLRLGGAEQLQAYSRILGASFRAVTGRKALDDACHQARAKKLILIDTPGFGRGDMDETRELAAFASGQPNVDVHLVIPACLHFSAMSAVLERFAIFRPAKLIFTHIDEMENPACMLEAALRSGLPISFLTNGQQIPEDLAEASKADLRLSLAQGLKQRVAAAA